MLLPASDQVSVTADQPQLLCAAAPLRHRLAIPLFQGPSPAHGASVVIWQSQNMLFHQRQSGPSPGCCWASFTCCKQTPFGETEASQHLAGNTQENFSSAVCLWNSGVLKSWKIYMKITNWLSLHLILLSYLLALTQETLIWLWETSHSGLWSYNIQGIRSSSFYVMLFLSCCLWSRLEKNTPNLEKLRVEIEFLVSWKLWLFSLPEDTLCFLMKWDLHIIINRQNFFLEFDI